MFGLHIHDDQVIDGVRGLVYPFVEQKLWFDADFAFVVGQDCGGFLQEVFVLRRLDMGLIGFIIDIDFKHIGGFGVVLSFGGIHGEYTFFAVHRSSDVVFADFVVGCGLSGLYAEFEYIEYGRGLGRRGEYTNKYFFMMVSLVGELDE